MARPVNPNSARQRILAARAARRTAGGTVTRPAPTLATDNGKLVIPRGLVESIERLASDRRKSREHNPHLNPFRVDPNRLHPPGCVPAKDVQMAMDSATGWAGNQWAAGGILNNVFAEGLVFPGYPYLSELALRPEYRAFSEIISTELTRKWIKFSGKGKSHNEKKDTEKDDDVTSDFLPPDMESPDEESTKEGAGNDKTDKIAELEEYMDNLAVRDAYRQWANNDGLFGRAHLFHEIAGNFGQNAEGQAELKSDIGLGVGDLSKSKVNQNAPLTALRNVEPVWVYPTTYNAMNPVAPDFYTPQVWYAQGVEYHVSRLFTLIGRPVPDLLKPSFSFGGISLTQLMQAYVDIWLETRESIGRLIHAFSVMVLATDLQSTMQPGGGALIERANLFNAFRDNNGLFLLNKNTEEFSNVSVPLSGLHELQAQAQEHLCSISRIPTAVYTGISPTGLNASSEGEIRIWENTIHAYQEAWLRKPLTRTVNFCMLSLWGEIDQDITFDFVPLRELTEKEEAELRKLDAETDDILVNGCNALSPEEVRKRVAADDNGPHADIDPDDMPEPPPMPGMGEGGEPLPGGEKPGGRINISGRQAFTGVGSPMGEGGEG